MTKEPKDYGKSVKAKLLNLSKTERISYQLLLIRYVHERLLYRLAQSKYKNSFYLKGGALLYAHEQLKARPTLDIDFLGSNINNDRKIFEKAFSEICTISCKEDGIIFDTGIIETEDINENRVYKGIRLHIMARLDTVHQKIAMDIGFGDIITPEPQKLEYPLLLDGLPAVNIMAYSLETVVAEKFHAMIELSESNSRLKDFFDVYQLFTNHEIESELLAEAIVSTFKNRNTSYRENLALFTDKFATDATRNIWWKAFLKKIRWKEQIEFSVVMKCIKENLQDYWSKETLG